MQTLRGVYAQIAVHWFCPKKVFDLLYVAVVLGHWQAKTQEEYESFAADICYIDYAIDGLKGVRLEEPGVQVVDPFQQQGDEIMTQTDQQVVETATPKAKGTFTLKFGTYHHGKQLIQERGYTGDWLHDQLVNDLMQHDAVAHQMYPLLEPLSAELGTDGPIATLQALIATYRAGGGAVPPELAQLLVDVDTEEPVAYLRGLVERNKRFQKAIKQRGPSVDYREVSLDDLRKKYRTEEAANERYRRAVDAVMRHNEEQSDPMHMWFINASIVKDLVGGRLDFIGKYLDSRKEEIDAHHQQFGLTVKANRKPIEVTEEVVVE